MDITIREIQESDYLHVLSLWNNELGNSSVNQENIYPHYERMKNDNRYQTYVAFHENAVIGFITAVQSFAVGFEIGFLHITGLAVREEHQNKGIGTKLLKHMENYAAERGVSSILLNSGFQRTGAHAFYEHRGYDKKSYCFTKKV
jgi:PhnO protein